MSDHPDDGDVITLDDLPPEADDFDPCEEGENHEPLAPGLMAFGTTSRHVLASWLPAAFKKWGVRYKIVEGAATRGRPISAGYFDPNGLLIHHTGSTSSAGKPAPSLATVTNGRSDLKGPLCQVSTDFNGLTYIVAYGRANHAGSARAAMGNPAGDGNAMYLGNEVQTSGTQKMPAAQYEAVILSSAAILDHFGYTNANKLGLHHTTSSSGKWDLGAGTGAIAPYSLTKLRADVTARLKAGPPGAPAPPAPPVGDDMAADFDTARELFTKHPVMLHPATGKRVTPSAVIEYGAKEAAAANKAVAALAAQVKALADAPAGVVQMDDEQLERVLRKVLGSVDGVQS